MSYTPGSGTRRWNSHTRFWWMALLILLGGLMLTACDIPGISGNGVGNNNSAPCNGINVCNKTSNTTSSTSSSTPSNDFTPLPTPTPTPIQSYRANWANGMDGWIASDQGWSAVSGLLVNDGNEYNYDGTPSIFAPFPAGDIANYSVQAEIRLDKYTDEGTNTHISFGIVARYSGNNGGYKFGPCGEAEGLSLVSYCDTKGMDVVHEIQLSDGNFYQDNPLQRAAFNPEYGKWHTYRMDVNGNIVTVWLDGSQLWQVTNDRYLSGGKVGLWSDRCQLSIRNFTVTALGK